MEPVGAVGACSVAQTKVGVVVGGIPRHDILRKSKESAGREGNKSRDELHSG